MKIIDNKIIYEIIDNENIKMKRETWTELLSRIHYFEKRFDKIYNDNIKWQDSWFIQTEKIEKAVEYIENNKEKQYGYNYEYGLTDKNIDDLLNILQNGSDDNE